MSIWNAVVCRSKTTSCMNPAGSQVMSPTFNVETLTGDRAWSRQYGQPWRDLINLKMQVLIKKRHFSAQTKRCRQRRNRNRQWRELTLRTRVSPGDQHRNSAYKRARSCISTCCKPAGLQAWRTRSGLACKSESISTEKIQGPTWPMCIPMCTSMCISMSS